MTARTRRAGRLLTAAALTVGVAACTADDDPVPQDTVVPPPVVTELTATPEATGTPTAAAPTEQTTAPADAATGDDLPTAEETGPAALPPFAPAGTPQTTEPSGQVLLPVDLRVGDHDGFDRVVVELAGDGVPGWRTEYVTAAIEDGRGNRLDVDGDAILSVYVSGTRYPEEGEDHYAPRGAIDGPDIVEEVHYVGTFEGLTQLFIGVDDGLADYRVFALADPARVVIDIADPDD